MVTFETQCYENDYEYILKGDRLATTITNCNYKFDRRIVIINKVFNKKKVTVLAEKKKAEGIIDEFYFSDDYIDRALRFFKIQLDSFKGGLNYSRAQFVGMYLCQTPYLLHFTTDTQIAKTNTSTWIQEAIQLMEEDKKYVCANPCWNNMYDGAKEESFTEIKDWYIGYGFSDNCYLVPTQIFKQPIYGEYNPASDRYPAYAGECFEKRVDSYMRNHHRLRLTNKHISFTTKNYPKKTSLKMIGWYTIHSKSILNRLKKFPKVF